MIWGAACGITHLNMCREYLAECGSLLYFSSFFIWSTNKLFLVFYCEICRFVSEQVSVSILHCMYCMKYIRVVKIKSYFLSILKVYRPLRQIICSATENTFCTGDHISWHSPLDNSESRIQHMLLTEDPQMQPVQTPFGLVSFLQVRHNKLAFEIGFRYVYIAI